MTLWCRLTCAALLALAPVLARAAPLEVTGLCYHDVRRDVEGRVDADGLAVSTAHLAAHFGWLRANGYTPVSLDDIEAARRGARSLPPRPVLLSFDDGLESFHDHVLPLLQRFDYPAVFAVVTRWIENDFDPDRPRPYPGRDFASAKQLREIADSGLVEIASHSHDSHRGVLANPQGNRQAALVTRAWDPARGDYETEQQYRARVRADLARSAELIERYTGRRPRTMVWPYGEYGETAWDVARDLGFVHSLVLGETDQLHARDAQLLGAGERAEEGEALLPDAAAAQAPAGPHIRRKLIMDNPDVVGFAAYFRTRDWHQPTRVVHVDLDYVHDRDPVQQQRNLDALVQRIADYRINTVYLQAYADADGDGHADALYFHNRHLPVRADLFGHVAWQLHTRAGVKVFAWMPVSAFVLPQEMPEWMVQRRRAGRIEVSDTHYRRLSIFHPDAVRWIDEIYQDLARYTNFQGLLFHDDGVLADDEDYAPQALAYYARHGGNDILDDAPRWTALKTRALIDFTHARAATVRRERPQILTARNLFAMPVLEPASEAWYAQSLPAFAAAYDQTAIMAMPWMEKTAEPMRWLQRLREAVRASGVDVDRVVFELQSRDWNTGEDIPAAVLARQMAMLERSGAVHFGYYPDDFLHDHPRLEIIRPHFSLEDFPWRRP